MAILDRKLWRDIVRMRAQVLAIALVMACGVATIVAAVGAYRSLEETRRSFYERYRFGTVFATVTQAPLGLRDRLASISGIAGVELRIVESIVLDIAGMSEPATGLAVSLPDRGEPAVNRLYLRNGRMPAPERVGEVAVLESFAKAHSMEPGSTFRAVMNGRLRQLTVTGTVLSPEFIYAISPGDLVPDQRRFGVIFMPREALAGLFDLEGAFNDLTVLTLLGADNEEVMARVDNLLEPYGGTGAHHRDEQQSHKFLDAELSQLRAMAVVIPPIFLFVAAFLVNMILGRMIGIEREQIGLLKAVGYDDFAIAWHYAKLAIVIALVGIVVGAFSGAWLGQAMTRLYGAFFSFPYLIFHQSFDLHALAAGVTVAAALAGAARSIRGVVWLPAAVAMRPPAPPRYRRLFSGMPMTRVFSQLTVMAFRHILRWPLRAALTVFGISLPVALLITALFSFDSIDFMVETVFFRAERQDATVTFPHARAPAALQAVSAMPGVLVAEPFRSQAIILRNGHRERRLSISGVAIDADLTRILNADLDAIEPPSSGLMISRRVAESLHLRTGDLAGVELIGTKRGRVQVPVTSIVESFIGLAVYMRNDALNRLIGDGERVSGVRLSLDGARTDELYAAIKRTPGISSISLQSLSREHFRALVAENIATMMSVFVVLAVIITFGVVYNSARIQVAEQARELASLRVFGFTRAEVSSVPLIELGVVVLAAQPLGWLIGYLFSWSVTKGLESDLFKIPFVVDSSTLAYASLVVMAAAAISALIVRRRIDRLDLVRVLKTRE